MKITLIEARDLPEAWFLCCKRVMEEGREYTIDAGSYAGQKRMEFDLVTVRVKYPATRPLVPDTPAGIPPPTSMDYVESYLPYLMEPKDIAKEKELYTYGDCLSTQIQEVIKKYIKEGFDNNRCCMSVGSKESIFLEHSQCLRLIDTRILDNSLNFVVYFRSWDLWGGFPANLAGIQLLKEYMADAIGVSDGELVAFSKGLHLYDHCWELAKALIHR